MYICRHKKKQMKLIVSILTIVLGCVWGSNICLAQEVPIARNDTISINNESAVNEITYKEIDFLKNDSSIEQAEAEIVSQTLKNGKAYLIEQNRMMIFYPYEKSFGSDTIYYRVCAADKCSSAKVIVDVLNPKTINVFVPSSFSPNGDGINDKFFIKGIENYPDNNFYVFSRWGSKVYETKNYSNNSAWNGYYSKNGAITENKLPCGTYFYKLVVKEKNSTKSGYIIIKY